MLVLYDNAPADPVATGTNFFGFGIGGGFLRYQVAPGAGSYHAWFNGTSNMMNLTNTALNVLGNVTATGTIRSSSNIISTSTGTIGYSYPLTNGFFDLTDTVKTQGFVEQGNPGKYGSMFHQGFLSGSNNSGENINWNRARLFVRGCSLNTNDVATNVTLNIRCYNSNFGSNTTLSQIICKDYGSLQGYTMNISPFFSLSNVNNPYLGLQLATSNVSYRVGSASIIFSS